MAPLIGEFEVDPSAIQETPLAPKGENVRLNIVKAERKISKENTPYINLQITAVDYPGNTFFNVYSMSAKALGSRKSSFSWKRFLDKLGLPYTTTAAEIQGLTFVGQLKHTGPDDEKEIGLDKVVGPSA